MRRKWLTPAAVVCAGFLVGCASTVVHKDPGPHDRGVRFYRPKPYLFIQPFGEAKTTGAGDKAETITKMSDTFVTMKLEWLPDFSEEYSIRAKTGIGKNETSFKLENGWNLTELNMKLDSEVPENITAVAKLLEAVPKVVGGFSSAGEGARERPTVVAASNVPLGYYESVISPGPDGRKRLYGWRYVGFIPYATCPVEASGLECLPCDAGKIYGLGFENGVMTFRPLPAMATDGKKVEVPSVTLALNEANVKSVVARIMNNRTPPILEKDYTVTPVFEPVFGATVTVHRAVLPDKDRKPLGERIGQAFREDFGLRALPDVNVVYPKTP